MKRMVVREPQGVRHEGGAAEFAREPESETECTGCLSRRSGWTENFGKGYLSYEGDFYCCQLCARGHLCVCSARVATIARRSGRA